MKTLSKPDASTPALAEHLHTATLRRADQALEMTPPHITDAASPRSAGGPNDYFSEGNYWWPDPDAPDGAPFIQRDGLEYPGNFKAHRVSLMKMKQAVAALAAAWRLTGRAEYAHKAAVMLREFFLDPATRMAPHMRYAQAVPGHSTGRGIGIIDTLHLVEVAMAILALRDTIDAATLRGLREWFGEFALWLMTHPYGRDELTHANNHAVSFVLQVAGFARLTGDAERLRFCRERFRTTLLPDQMASDGGFPRELRRTKPYGYSLFQLDNLALLAHVASTADDDLWTFALEDGRCLARGLEFMVPYIADKSQWPYPPDVENDEEWPVNHVCLLLGGLALNRSDYVALWQRLPATPTTFETWRNLAVTQPVLWLEGDGSRYRN